MSRIRRSPWALVALWLAAASLALPAQAAGRKTVCTITVNSAEEKEAFRRHLPASQYTFVELVERGRPDWLASSCQRAVACDLLIVSGHFDGEDHFFSDRLDVSQVLRMSELEQASCSNACPMLFSRLKEVYLFGCNTLNPAPNGESSRDRMRQVFSGVPVIYGFPSAAPLGPVAGATLNRGLSGDGSRDIARGRPNARLLKHFAPYPMSWAVGVTDDDPRSRARHDMCQFADARLSAASKLEFAHQLLQHPLVEVSQHLDRIQRLVRSVAGEAPQAPAVASTLQRIAQDVRARTRFLQETRATPQTPTRVRLIDIAQELGWLSPDQRWQELALMLGELQARREVALSEVDLICSLNGTRDLEGAFNRRVAPGGPEDDVAHAALRACLGSSEGHVRTLRALVGADEADARIAQAYLRHRPITDPTELGRLVADILAMPPSAAQVRALDALGRHHLSDPALLESLTGLLASTTSWAVQNAVAGVLIRAERRSLPRARIEAALQQNRRPSPSGNDMIGALASSLLAR